MKSSVYLFPAPAGVRAASCLMMVNAAGDEVPTTPAAEATTTLRPPLEEGVTTSGEGSTEEDPDATGEPISSFTSRCC